MVPSQADSIPNSGLRYDEVIQSITDYVYHYKVTSQSALRRARAALLDSIGCAIESVPACSSFIGPIVKNTVVPNGFPLPGTSYRLDPLKAAFDFGTLIRYLDHNDAVPGKEWGHPSDSLGAILPVADWLSREGDNSVTMLTVLELLIKAYEIQGTFQNSFNQVGLDHVILVKIATTATLSKLLGLSQSQANDAVSHAFADGHPLRVYRQSPNTGPRKGWAAGDACMRAVHIAILVRSGQPGMPTVLTTPKWGFYDTLFKGDKFVLPVPFTCRIIQGHFFKLVAAEGHGISAVEAALKLSKTLDGRLGNIASITIRTHGPAMIIINKPGPLHNAADRDHCMRYMVAVCLLKQAFPETSDYSDESPWASDLRIETLRNKITMVEDAQMTKDYYGENPAKKGASAVKVVLKGEEEIPEVLVECPIGHPLRPETIDGVRTKFLKLSQPVLTNPSDIWDQCFGDAFLHMPVRDWVDQFTKK